MSEWKSIGEPETKHFCELHKVWVTAPECPMCASERRWLKETNEAHEKAMREKVKWFNQFKRK